MINDARKSQKGMTLIELLVAITLSVVIAAAMISMFVNSKQSYRVNENMSRLQENARFAVSFLSRDIRMSDYRPCVGTIYEEDLLDDAVTGEEKGTVDGKEVPDTITIKWQVDDDNDCETASVVTTRIFSIQTGSGGGPALFRSIDGGASQELVEGIANLQILFGEDTDEDFVANYYVDADSIDDMRQTISTRFSLVARTLDLNIARSSDAITRDFASTVTLRNRLP